MNNILKNRYGTTSKGVNILKLSTLFYFFYKEVKDLLFSKDVKNSNLLSESILNTDMRIQLLRKRLNVLQTFPMPVQCAMISDIGVRECEQSFQAYTSFIYGVMSTMRYETIQNQIAIDIKKVQNYNTYEAYNANEMEYDMEKDVKFYRHLHILILGISEEYLGIEKMNKKI